MDSDRFDRWAKLLAQRMSRRTAALGLGTAVIASFASPTWTLAQDDDDQDDLDQHKDNPTSDGPDTDDQDVVGAEACQPVTRCKLNNGLCTDIGPIPGGPYEQVWVWTPIPGCAINGPDHLDRICDDSFTECDPWGCVPGIDGWAIGCH